MARAKWKFFYYSKDILNKSIILLSGDNLDGKNKLIFDRSSSIPNLFLGKKLRIHKGQFFRGLLVNKFIVGYKFGEFSYTRKPFKFLSKKKSKKK